MAKIQDHARPVGRVVALLVVLAAAAMLVRIPLVASAQAIKTGTDVAAAAPVAGQLDGNDAENGRAEASQSPPLPIDRQPLATFGASGEGDADLQAVADVWNKLRGSESKAHGAEDLKDALKRVQESAAAENDTRNAARNDLPADRYADDSDDVHRVAERLKPLRNEDPDLLRLAQAAIANQRVYDAELRERVKALRKAARNLDAIAADLDDAEFCDEADELFDAARSLRLAARRRSAPPREMRNTYRDDTEAALAYNLHTLRAQLQLYRTEHDGRYPKVQADGNGQPSLPQLTGATNADGDIGAGGEYSAGPYLITIPDNPLDGRNYIEETSTWPPAAATPNGGWLYHEPTGQIAPNTPGHLAD